MALTTLNSVKNQAGISLADTSRDGQLRVWIDGMTSLVKRHLNRDIESREYVEYYTGDGSPLLLLRQFPVTAVTTVCVDNEGYFGALESSFDSSMNLAEGTGYALVSGGYGPGSNGIIRRIGAVWSRPSARARGVLQTLSGSNVGNIKVQYTAGFATIPAALQLAVNSAVIKQLATAGFGGAVSQLSYEDASIGFVSPSDGSALLGTVESILASYRSVPI